MALNIKNERVHELARQAAAASGQSQTSAIEAALQQYLRGLGADPDEAEAGARAEAVRQIAAEFRADVGRANTEVRVIADLYDDAGLPK